MAYVDGFVCAIPEANLEKYRAMAELGAKVWRDHGALEYHEWLQDDVPEGELTSFQKSVLLQPGEVVVIAHIVYASREDRDRVNAAVMADPRMHMRQEDMPFDMKRMIYGGFKGFVSG